MRKSQVISKSLRETVAAMAHLSGFKSWVSNFYLTIENLIYLKFPPQTR